MYRGRPSLRAPGCKWLWAFLLLPLCTAIGSAQEPDLEDLTDLSVEDLSRVHLSTASRHLTDARKAPALVTSIDAEEIKKQGWQTLADLLRSVPGLYTAYDRLYSYVGVRGFLQSGDYNARVLLLIDGHRANENIYDSALIGTEFPLDMSLIDHVEIVVGPSSSLYGTNAELAVINVFTKRPGRQSGVEVAAEERSHTGRVFEANATFRLRGGDGLVAGSIYRSNGNTKLYFPEFDTPETNSGVAQSLDGDRYDHVFGLYRYGQFRIEGLFGKRDKIIPTASYETLFNDPGNRSIDTRSYIDAKYSRQFGSDTDLDLRVYYDAYRFWGSYPYKGDLPNTRVLQINAATADWLGLEAIVGQRLGEHRIVAGVSGEYNFLHQWNYYVGQPRFLDNRPHLAIGAVFGEAELNPYQWLSVNLGGRLDEYSSSGVSFSPRVAVMWLPTKQTSVKYIYGRAFRAPDPYDQFYVDQIDVTGTNIHLRSETIHSNTILFEHTVNSWLRWSASAFHNHLKGTIENEFDPSTGTTHFMNEKGDRSRGFGIELSAKNRSNWSGRTSYELTKSIDQEPGTFAMNAPNHVAKFNGIAPLGGRGFLGLEFLFTGRQTSHLGNRIGSSFLGNATLSTPTIGSGWSFSASCYNLFDRHWSTPTGPEVIMPAVPQDGRTFRFRVNYSWKQGK